MGDKANKGRDIAWGARIIAVVGWTILCALAWFVWVLSMSAAPVTDPKSGLDPDAILGMAACMSAGCAGGVWFFGLVVFAVIYTIIRR